MKAWAAYAAVAAVAAGACVGLGAPWHGAVLFGTAAVAGVAALEAWDACRGL